MNTLQSSALPLDAGGFVVTVVTPNKATFQALLGAINKINPAAFTPDVVPHGIAAALIRDIPARELCSPEGVVPARIIPSGKADDDEGEPYVIPGCATGQCGVD